MLAITIIICTRNRAEHLRQTLVSLNQVHIPAHTHCELIVVDNASHDSTQQVVESAAPQHLALRYLCEPQPGQCHARNAGLHAVQGDIVLFTDDDVRLPHDWIEQMCAPILAGQAHGVAGGIKLAPYLERSWLQPLQRGWLAATTDATDADATATDFTKDPHLIGANMAFSKEVLTKVPAFDVELGPGALGFMDDTLFSRQLQRAGYRVVATPNVAVEHHFEASRLSRSGFLAAAQKRGRSGAYVGYHWEHRNISVPRLRLAKSRLLLALGRAVRQKERMTAEGIPLWEMNAVWSVHYFQQYLRESQRPHHYEQYGLVKLKA